MGCTRYGEAIAPSVAATSAGRAAPDDALNGESFDVLARLEDAFERMGTTTNDEGTRAIAEDTLRSTMAGRCGARRSSRIRTLSRSGSTAHHLAIAINDRSWLGELFASWAPEGEDGPVGLYARGQIGLALGPWGPRPHGWSAEEQSCLEEDGYLRRDGSHDQAWRALADGDLSTARQAMTAYETMLVGLPQQWEHAPAEGLRQALSYPDLVLQFERRALGVLVARGRGA